MKRFIALVVVVCMLAVPGFVTSRRDTSSDRRVQEITRDVSPTWLTDVSVADSVAKVDAVRETMYVLEAHTNENHIGYINNILVDPANALWPVGNKSCLSSASVLYTEMQAVQAITDAYDIAITKTGGMAGYPTAHYMVEMLPRDGVGPSLLIDRYSDYGPLVLTIERKYVTGKKKGDDRFVYISLHVSDPWAMIDGWYEILTPEPEPVYCSWEFDHVVLEETLTDIDVAKAVLDSAVESVTDGLPCGNSISKKYNDRSCPAGAAAGINYISRCVWSDLGPGGYETLTTYIVGYGG